MQKQLAKVEIFDPYKLSLFLNLEAVFQSTVFVEKILNANNSKKNENLQQILLFEQ